VLVELAHTVRAAGLSRQPFLDLVEANLRDQTVTGYASWGDLLRYCALSANPVGRMVLEVFTASTPDRVQWSDRICTALQVIEHCQDVGEDHRNGRVYLPAEDLDRFGVTPDQLGAAVASARLRRLIEFEARRALDLLAGGAPLLAELRGWARLAVAGYVAGGRAAVTTLHRHGWAVLPAPPPRRKRTVAAAMATTWTSAVLSKGVH
jgi:squalene synthase HpnC